MRRDVLFLVCESAQINDVSYARFFRRKRKIMRGLNLVFGVPMSKGHVVDEIIRRMHILECGREGGWLHHIAVDNTYFAGPAPGAESLRIPRQRADCIAAIQ